MFFGSFGYPFYPYSYYGYPYSYGYPYYSSYSYGYPYYGSYSSDYYPYDYGYNNYNQPRYRSDSYGGSMVVEVQRRLAREGYYHGPIDGIMGTRTHYAIRAYERSHGLRVDGVISNQLLGTMGLR